MINRNIDQITKDDLQSLIDNEVTERKTIEYKQALPGNSDKEKKEFLADVSSFANASGGDLIYGITEDRKTGKPKSLDGLDIVNIDQVILRLDNVIRTGLQPRLPAVNISPPITLDNSKIALVIRIPKSWISPHRVIHNDKFYSRSSNGKYPLDVRELRNAFNLSETITERIRNFRTDRIAKIYANETPLPFYDSAKIVLHLIPIISFSTTQAYDVSIIASQSKEIRPIYCPGCNKTYNLDGVLIYSPEREGKSYSYVQLFRSGVVEAVEGELLEPVTGTLNKDLEGKLIIPSRKYEEELIRSFSNYLSYLEALNVDLPVVAFLSLLGVKGYSIGVSSRITRHYGIYTIDRDILLLPEAIIESYDVSADEVLRPCFDSIWNACGFPKDFYYNEEGEWSPPK